MDLIPYHYSGIIQVSLYTSHILPKGATSCSSLLINFKYNNYIQDKKPLSGNKKRMWWEPNKRVNLTAHSKFFLYIDTKFRHLFLGT